MRDLTLPLNLLRFDKVKKKMVTALSAFENLRAALLFTSASVRLESLEKVLPTSVRICYTEVRGLKWKQGTSNKDVVTRSVNWRCCLRDWATHRDSQNSA